MKLYLWRKFSENVSFSKNISCIEMNPKALRGISNRMLYRKYHSVVATRRLLKAGTMELCNDRKKVAKSLTRKNESISKNI